MIDKKIEYLNVEDSYYEKKCGLIKDKEKELPQIIINNNIYFVDC
ncbi:MAG TPA: hypothetical protein VFR65_07035 [Nitrososphaeraceae archaeon]|nr:hypothetical protein [Nitrososphaeraceae archaeon]